MAPTTAAVDSWIAKVRRCEHLTESELKALCDLVREILMEESNVQPVSSPVIVCGDVHGQFFDVLELFRVGGEIPGKSYVFMGDFVDRGRHSVETLQLLLCYKARFPDCITLLRGNHECRQVTQVYGFYDECFRKYGSANAWKYCTEVFDYFALAAVIDSKVLCVHGGLSPRISTLDQIRLLERNQEIPHEGAYCDLMWSDPEEIEDWAVSQRGGGLAVRQQGHGQLQPHQRPRAHRQSASAGAGGIQVHVPREEPHHRLVRSQLSAAATQLKAAQL